MGFLFLFCFVDGGGGGFLLYVKEAMMPLFRIPESSGKMDVAAGILQV